MTEIHNFFETTIPNTPPVQDTFKCVPGARTRQTIKEQSTKNMVFKKKKQTNKNETLLLKFGRNEQQDGELLYLDTPCCNKAIICCCFSFDNHVC